MPATKQVATAEGGSKVGPFVVNVETMSDPDAPADEPRLAWITTDPSWDQPDGSELCLPLAMVEDFHRVLGDAIAEAKRSGMLPKGG